MKERKGLGPAARLSRNVIQIVSCRSRVVLIVKSYAHFQLPSTACKLFTVSLMLSANDLYVIPKTSTDLR